MSTHMAAIPSMDELRAVLASDDPVRLEWDGGLIDIERPLPVLVVVRSSGDPDRVAPRLVSGLPSCVVLTADDKGAVDELVATIADVQADRFDVFALVEVWTGRDEDGRQRSFVVGVPDPTEPPQPVETLVDALGAFGSPVVVNGERAPVGREPLLASGDPEEGSCLALGLEVPPLYRDPETGSFYPSAFAELRTTLHRALQRFFFEFIRVHSSFELKDHRELGRRTIVDAGYEVDRRLSEIGAELNPLFHMTPVNSSAERDEFFASDCQKEPSFHYRLLPFDPDLLKRELYELPLETVEDPTVGSLLRAKRLEIDRTITLLEERDTPRFLHGSIQLYGGIERSLMDDALHILDATEPGTPTDFVPMEELAASARAELDFYRRQTPELTSSVEIRPDMPGVMVSRGNLMLGGGRVARSRIEPLVQHEVGTHVITFHNGSVQPLLLLSAGLPGYEETQEGFATFAEYMVGGLDTPRLRQVAARVIATRDVTEGATFAEVFNRLTDEFGFARLTAWSITMRATRSGGSVKDAIYLRGLLKVLSYLRDGGSLEPLLVGKIALEQVPLIEELLWRGVLENPRIVPRWLTQDGSQERLDRARDGMTALDLIGVQR